MLLSYLFSSINYIKDPNFSNGPQTLSYLFEEELIYTLLQILSSCSFQVDFLPPPDASCFPLAFSASTLSPHLLLSKSLTPASGPTPDHCVDGKDWGDELPHTINRASTLQDYPHLTDSWQKISLTTHVRVNSKSLTVVFGGIFWGSLSEDS